MKAQHLLLMGVLLFWGWQVGQWLLAALMLGLWLIFSLRGSSTELTLRSFYQLADLAVLLLIAIAAWYWLDDDVKRIVFPTLQLLPMAMFPLLLAQAVDKRRHIPRATFLFLQRKQSENTQWFDFGWAYMLLCLLSAGAHPSEQGVYFVAVVAVIWVWLILQQGEHKRHHIMAAGLMFGVVAALAFAVYLLMQNVQQAITQRMNTWLMSQYDQSSHSSNVGEIGREKLSDDIVLRLRSVVGEMPPPLLRRMSYQHFFDGQWFGGAGSASSVEKVGQHWIFERPTPSPMAKRLMLYQPIARGQSELSLPDNTLKLSGAGMDALSLNQGGRVEVVSKLPLLALAVDFVGENIFESPPEPADWQVAKPERALIQRVASALHLWDIRQQQGDKAVAARIRGYLFESFRYLSWEDNPRNTTSLQQPKPSLLEDFLLLSKAGHCEHFATATVLLLREAGIAARYVVGYAVSEQSDDWYVVRGRDAHAWAVAYMDGVWQVVDSTPPDWREGEHANTWLQDVKDMLSAWKFSYQTWRYGDEKIAAWVWYVVLGALFVILAWRILSRVEMQQRADQNPQLSAPVISDWLLLEQALGLAFGVRKNSETLMMWLTRIQRTDLLPLAMDYYAIRFSNPPQAQQLIALNHQVALHLSALHESRSAEEKQTLHIIIC